MGKQLSARWAILQAWLRKQLSQITIGVVILIDTPSEIRVLAEDVSHFARSSFHTLIGWRRLVLLIFRCGFDCPREIGVFRRRYDPKTLKGRTLELQDRIRAFLDGLVPMPQGFTGTSQVRACPDWRSPDGHMHNSSIVRVNGPLSQRMAKVDHEYELHFAVPLCGVTTNSGFAA